MNEVIVGMAIIGGICTAVVGCCGAWAGRKLGHLEAYGAMTWPKSKDHRVLECKVETNKTLRLCGLPEIE